MPVARGGNVANLDDVGGPEAWFKSLPFVTQVWFGATLFLTLTANFGLFSPYKLFFIWGAVKDQFEAWRLATAFCYAGPFKFNTLITLYMLVNFSRQYEAGGPFNTGAGGGTADYAFMLMVGMIATLCTYPLLMLYFPLAPVFARTMVFYVLYIWSKRNPTAPANIWGVPMKGSQLPWAYLALSVVTGDAYHDYLHGLVLGHLYYFLVDVLPAVHGTQVLHTPEFLIDIFGIGEYRPDPTQQPQQPQGGGFGQPPGRVNPPNDPAGPAGGAAAGGAARRVGRGGHNWGTGGQRLGTN
mmetsp:Transcript_18624/g.26280  ORF Transcript_18624/g.26280 Transcript_18624/m.26280 type:complete len:297 (-) Transcript_18624:148-1038(-)